MCQLKWLVMSADHSLPGKGKLLRPRRVGGSCQKAEGSDRNETDASEDDSFKMAFRELRGSIDPNLNLEI